MKVSLMKIDDLYQAAQVEEAINDPDTAHLVIDKDNVADKHQIDGVEVETTEIEDGVSIKLTVKENQKVEHPIHLCFGMTYKTGQQNIEMDVELKDNSKAEILAHCVFPQAEEIIHKMEAEVNLKEGSEFKYLEKHVHDPEGKIKVISDADVNLDEGAKYKTDFELLEGRAGLLELDYETYCSENSTVEMKTKVDAKKDDKIKIKENAFLNGENSRGVLTTRVALRDEAKATVENKLIAEAPEAKGHVDCKEIVQDNADAKAIPIVQVKHPKAHVTHEAAIGSVDKKQLETLMLRGLSEDEGVDLIIDSLLRKNTDQESKLEE